MKHPKPVLDGLSKCMWSVFDTFRRPCHTKIGKIEAFIVRHENIDLACAKLEELEKLNMALKEQWGCMAAAWDNPVVSSEGLEILI